MSSTLIAAAEQIAETFRQRQAGIQEKKARLEADLREAEANLYAANLAPQRLATFVEHRDGRLQCPCCWIKDEVATDLATMPGNHRDDKFRCRVCHFEISIPA